MRDSASAARDGGDARRGGRGEGRERGERRFGPEGTGPIRRRGCGRYFEPHVGSAVIAAKGRPGRFRESRLMVAVAGFHSLLRRTLPGPSRRQARLARLAFAARTDAGGPGKFHADPAVGPVAEDDRRHDRQDGENDVQKDGRQGGCRPHRAATNSDRHGRILTRPPRACQ